MLITRNFPPRWGGMERLNWHIAEELAREFDILLLAPKGALSLPSNIDYRPCAFRPWPWFFFDAGYQLLCQSKLPPRVDLVLAGSGLTAPLAWWAARRYACQAATYVHGLDVAFSHPLYRSVWLPCLRRMDSLIANSHATAQAAVQRGVAPEKIHVIHPGTARVAPDPAARQRFRSHHDWTQHLLLLAVGRLTQRKGLAEFIRLALPAIVNAHPNCLLLIAGEPPRAALRATPVEISLLQQAATEAGVGEHIVFLGLLTGESLTEAYHAADLHVFPVRTLANDPEGFGMVAIEAAAHGLPTVAFATGGVVDAVAHEESGWLCPPEDYGAFARHAIAYLERLQRQDATVNHLREQCRRFASRFEWQIFGDNIRQYCSRLIKTADNR